MVKHANTTGLSCDWWMTIATLENGGTPEASVMSFINYISIF